jgi:hypothetical protein
VEADGVTKSLSSYGDKVPEQLHNLVGVLCRRKRPHLTSPLPVGSAKSEARSRRRDGQLGPSINSVPASAGHRASGSRCFDGGTRSENPSPLQSGRWRIARMQHARVTRSARTG